MDANSTPIPKGQRDVAKAKVRAYFLGVAAFDFLIVRRSSPFTGAARATKKSPYCASTVDRTLSDTSY